MWISAKVEAMLSGLQKQLATVREEYAHACAEREALRAQNKVLQTNMDWMRTRLTQVERERGQLVQAAIGVKIAVPEFVPTYRPDEALSEMPSFGNVGGDAEDQEGTPLTGGEQAPENFSMMPRRK